MRIIKQALPVVFVAVVAVVWAAPATVVMAVALVAPAIVVMAVVQVAPAIVVVNYIMAGTAASLESVWLLVATLVVRGLS